MLRGNLSPSTHGRCFQLRLGFSTLDNVSLCPASAMAGVACSSFPAAAAPAAPQVQHSRPRVPCSGRDSSLCLASLCSVWAVPAAAPWLHRPRLHQPFSPCHAGRTSFAPATTCSCASSRNLASWAASFALHGGSTVGACDTVIKAIPNGAGTFSMREQCLHLRLGLTPLTWPAPSACASWWCLSAERKLQRSEHEHEHEHHRDKKPQADLWAGGAQSHLFSLAGLIGLFNNTIGMRVLVAGLGETNMMRFGILVYVAEMVRSAC